MNVEEFKKKYSAPPAPAVVLNQTEHPNSFKLNGNTYPIRWIDGIPYLYTVRGLLVYKNKFIYVNLKTQQFPTFIRQRREGLYELVENISGYKTAEIHISDDMSMAPIDFVTFPELSQVSYLRKGMGTQPMTKAYETSVLFKLIPDDNVTDHADSFFDLLQIFPEFTDEDKNMMRAYFSKEDPQMNQMLLTLPDRDKVSPASDAKLKEDSEPTALQEADDPIAELNDELDKQGAPEADEKDNKDDKEVEEPETDEKDTPEEDQTEEEPSEEDDTQEEPGVDEGEADFENMDGGDDTAEDSSTDTSSSSMDDEEVVKVNKNIMNLSRLDRAIADRTLFENFQTLFSRLDGFRNRFNQFKLKLDDDYYQDMEVKLSELLEVLERYINFKYSINNYEDNLTYYSLVTSTFNRIAEDIKKNLAG